MALKTAFLHTVCTERTVCYCAGPHKALTIIIVILTTLDLFNVLKSEVMISSHDRLPCLNKVYIHLKNWQEV